MIISNVLWAFTSQYWLHDREHELQILSYYHHARTKDKSRFSFYSFLILALDRGQWSALCPAHTSPPWRKDPLYPLDRWLNGPHSQSRQRLEKKSFASAGDWTPFAHSVVKTLYWLCYIKCTNATVTESMPRQIKSVNTILTSRTTASIPVCHYPW
jgi:hypothetical protein